MTNYKRYSDEQRNDPELRHLVKAELRQFHQKLDAASALLEEAYKLLMEASVIEEDNLDQGSGLLEARRNVYSAIKKFDYKISNPPTETYIGNIAAGMAPEVIDNLRRKYAE